LIDIVRVGIVGAGMMGAVHARAYARTPGAQIVTIVNRHRDRAEALVAEVGGRAESEIEAVLADATVDLVDITLPAPLHARVGILALEAGKHVVVEKPLAMTAKEALEVLRVAKKHPNLVAAVNFNIRFYPLNLDLRARIQSGTMGSVYHIRGAYLQDWLYFPDDFNWRLMPGEGGTSRAVGDVGTHWLDLIHFLTGLELEAVMADLKTVHPIRRRPMGEVETYKDKEKGAKKIARKPVRITTEDYGPIMLRYKGGIPGVLTVSQVNAGRKNRLEYEIAGSKAAAAWVSERPEEMWLGSRVKPNEVLLRDPSLLEADARAHTNYPGGHAEGFPDTFKQLYRAVYRDINAGKPSAKPLYATLQDGYVMDLIVEAVLESNKKKAWVRI